MKKTILFITGLFFCLANTVFAYDDGDFQVWNTETEEFKINQEAKIAFEQEFRWGGSAKEFYYMLQSSKGTQWSDINVLGTKLKLSF